MKKENINFQKESLAIGKLLAVLDSEGSSHENLLDAVYECVRVRKRCPKKEFMDMLEEYKYMKKVR